MGYCCQDKKYFSELCPACVEAMTIFDASDLDYPHYSEYSAKEWPGSVIETKVTCECGSEKTGGPGHSSWCPKFES